MGKKRELSLRAIGKITGICFLVIVVGYTLNWTLIYSKLISPGNDLLTVSNISNNELLIRFGIISDLIIAVFTIILAWSLYNILKIKNKEISLIALILRLMDPLLTLITVSMSYILLQLLNGEDYSVFFDSSVLLPFVGLFFNLHTSASTIPMVFTSIGFISFFFLLIQTNIVPKLLTVFGIISYILILIFVLIKILGMGDSSSVLGNIELLFYMPSVFFELIIGTLLIIKNVDIKDY